MPLTIDQVLALAPDASSASAGRKLGVPRDWRNLGANEVALWGDCQGSALYGVSVDLSDLTCKCTCPSRKFPCKHGLGLLLLHAAGQVPAAATPPERVSTWLTGRAERAAKKAEAPPLTAEDVGRKAAKAAEKLNDLGDAVAPFVLWLDDVARAGLGSLHQDGERRLRHEAARLVDAQAPGLAARCREVADQIGASAGWEEAVLAGLGELRLITHALGHLSALPDPVRADLRAAVGLPISQAEVRLTGAREEGVWRVGGVLTTVDGAGLRTRQTWLLRADDPSVHAVLIDVAAGAAALPAGPPPGQVFAATLARWPGALGQRALIVEPGPALDAPVAAQSIAAGLDLTATVLAGAPLARWVPLLLADVTVTVDARGAWVRDASGDGLPLPELPARLLAVAGTEAVSLCGLWDGVVLRPLTAWVGGRVLGLDVEQAVRRRSPGVRALVQAAQIGGDGALPPTPVDAVVPEGSRPQRLLWTAAALDIWSRAGARPGRPTPLAPWPQDDLPEAPEGVRDVLAIVGDSGTHPVTLELYRRVAARGQRLPAIELPDTLRRAHGSVVRPLLGARGRWLASLGGPSWEWACSSDAPADVETLLSPAARRAALRALRGQDPDAARAVLGRLLATEKADHRAELLLDLLPDVTPADLPLLDGLSGDRSAAVSDAVDQLRLTLGHDPHAVPVRARLAQALQVQASSGLAWLTAKVSGAAPRNLIVTLPVADDPTWAADGLPKLPERPGKPTTGLDRLLWLLRRVPPGELTTRTGMAAPELVAAIPSDLPELLGALATSAMRARDVGWIAALESDARVQASPLRASLLAALPHEVLVARLMGALRDRAATPPQLTPLLDAIPGILPAEVARALVDRVRTRHNTAGDAPHVRSAYDMRLLDVPDALLNEVADLILPYDSARTHHAGRVRLAAVLPAP